MVSERDQNRRGNEIMKLKILGEICLTFYSLVLYPLFFNNIKAASKLSCGTRA